MLQLELDCATMVAEQHLVLVQTHIETLLQYKQMHDGTIERLQESVRNRADAKDGITDEFLVKFAQFQTQTQSSQGKMDRSNVDASQRFNQMETHSHYPNEVYRDQ